MNGVGRLGELYGLSPATLAGLANIKGEQPPPVDPDSPEAWQAAAAAAGAPGGVRVPGEGQTYGDMQTPATKGIPKETPKPNMLGGTFINGEFVETPTEKDTPEAAPEPTRAQVGSGQAVPASPAYTVPAHWQAGNHSVSMQRGMAPEELEQGQYDRDVAAGQGLLAADKHLEAAQKAGMADAVYSSAHAMMSQRANEQIAAINQRKTEYVADQQKKLDALALETQKTVDPNALWKERGTGASISAAVMIGLGQFATMASGRGTNAALQIVNENIDRNIAAQRDNIANTHRAFDNASNLYQRNLATFGDEERATLATKVQYLDQVAALADAKRAEAGINQAEGAQHDFIRGIYEQRAKARDDFAAKTHTQVAEQETEHFVPTQTVGAGASKREENLVTLSDGTTFVMPSKEVAGESIKKIQVLDQLQRNNNEIMQLRAEAAKLNPVTDYTAYKTAIGKLKDLGEQKVALTSLALGQGVVKEEEYKRAQEINVGVTNGLEFAWDKPLAGPLRDSARESTDAMLRSQTKRWGNDQRAHVKAAGGAVYERGYARDAAGQLKPVGRYTGQDATPTEHLAPDGAKAMDKRIDMPTAGAPLKSTIPQSPRMDSSQPPSVATKPKKKGR